MMSVFIGVLCVLTVLLPDADAQKVFGNCAVGPACDHCPADRVRLMGNPTSSNDEYFKVCCSSCYRHFFSFNLIWATFCTCWDFKTVFQKPKVKTDNDSTGTIESDVGGNCWHGKNCTGCRSESITHSNGVAFCCPNCAGNSISVSSINNQHMCRCPQQKTEKTGMDVGGNCWHGSNCTGCRGNSVTYSNGVPFCCPNCAGNSISVSSINDQYMCRCPQQKTEKTGLDVSGNCWHGNNCTGCSSNSIAEINGVAFCCPNCAGNSVSVSLNNNQHRCKCPQQKKGPSINGNCLYDSECDGCSNVSYMNNRRFCCPGCRGSMRSYSDGQDATCNCY